MGELLKKLGIEDGIIQNILKGMKDNKIYTTNEEKLEERYNKLKEQKEDIEGQLNTVNATITDLKKNNKDNETLQEIIKAHEGTIEILKKDSAAKIRNLALDSAINNLLSSNKAKHSDLLVGKFDREKLVVDEDGKITGLDEQFKGIKETYKDLFEEKISGSTPANPEGGSKSNNTYEVAAHTMSIRPTKIQGNKVIFNRVRAGIIKDYTGSISWDEINTTPIEMTFYKKKYFAFSLDDCEKVQLVGEVMGATTAEHAAVVAETYDKEFFKSFWTNFNQVLK